MSLTSDQVFREALLLPDESKIALAERLVEYVETHIDRNLELMHIDIAKRRRDEIRSGQVQPIDGEEALAHVRRMVY
ncbi:MAG TPA: addiction module protein [Candidatus Deferrimicrobium sp.]|nr:addiction module protein [Candidatus Kapabacteria bacterium]HLP61808.1 addiction module protein [Candidatus Deferrimicrobium sp.]